MPLVHGLIAARYFTRQHKDESLYSNVEAFFVLKKSTLLVISQAVIRSIVQILYRLPLFLCLNINLF